MNPNPMFKQPVEVREKQLKRPQVSVFVVVIAMHGLLQTWIFIFWCLVNAISSSKLHFIKAIAYYCITYQTILYVPTLKVNVSQSVSYMRHSNSVFLTLLALYLII